MRFGHRAVDDAEEALDVELRLVVVLRAVPVEHRARRQPAPGAAHAGADVPLLSVPCSVTRGPSASSIVRGTLGAITISSST